MADPARPIGWWRVALALLVLAGAAEGASRLAIRQLLGRPFGSFDAYTFSGYGVYRQNPRYTHPQFVHDSAGFRNDRDFAIRKPPNTFRVMAIGASVLYSGAAKSHEGVSPRVHTTETITAYLESHLREMPELAGQQIEVINASVNRQKIRHTIAYTVAELGRYDPDLVLIFGTHNDTAYLAYSGAERFLFYDPERPTEEEARLELLANEASLRALVEKALRVAVDRSALAALAYRSVDRALLFVNLQRKSGLLEARSEALQVASDAEIEEALSAYLAALDALVTYVQGLGAEPVVFWEYQLLQVAELKPLSPYERGLVDWLVRSGAGLDADEQRRQLVFRDRVRERLATRGVRLIDVLDPLREHPGTVFNDYLHYTAEGNRAVAGWIAQEIRPVVAQAMAARAEATAAK